MKNFVWIHFIIVTIIFLSAGCHGNNGLRNRNHCYYISTTGDDHNPGSSVWPWKTLKKIETIHLSSGDTILLKGGDVFIGTLRLDSIVSFGYQKYLVLGSYGNGRAVIDGEGSEGIIVRKCDHFVISKLLVKGSGRKNGNSADGIYIAESHDFSLKGLEISGFQHSGLHLHICGNAEMTFIYSHDNGFAGINITGTTIDDSVYYDNKNIYIGNCSADNNPGDPTVTNNHSGNGILAASVKGGIIENCEASNNGWDMPWTGNGPVGIWIWDCRDFIIQYCVSHDNKTNPVAKDGGGFDLDGGVSNSVIQYCVSYNNQGAGYGLFEFGADKPWKNNTIRFDISQNDGILNEGSLAIWKNETAGTMSNCEIYNNTFYNDTARGNAISIVNNHPGFNFRNNVFIYRGSFLNKGQKFMEECFQGNCYWNLSGNKSISEYKNLVQWARITGNEMIAGKLVGKQADPSLLNPGKLKIVGPAVITKKDLSGYYPGPGSPLIGNGLDLMKLFNIDPGGKDISDNNVPKNNRYDIGAIEF
ncbi:MAG: right-handed parallel beta-helix repeat-containing protein [Bacteroidales bacterium]|jgi:hypothetical protein